jgi:hypothetical protein
MQSAEYLVVVQLLDRRRGRGRDAIYNALGHRQREEIDAALASLESVGVLTVSGRTVRASPALVCLEQLNLIAV